MALPISRSTPSPERLLDVFKHGSVSGGGKLALDDASVPCRSDSGIEQGEYARICFRSNKSAKGLPQLDYRSRKSIIRERPYVVLKKPGFSRSIVSGSGTRKGDARHDDALKRIPDDINALPERACAKKDGAGIGSQLIEQECWIGFSLREHLPRPEQAPSEWLNC
jgi:hypothetical protein